MAERESKEETKRGIEASVEFCSTVDAADAFLAKEREYVEEGLRKGYETFYSRLTVHNELKKSIISPEDIQGIFGNFMTIYTANKKLHSDLMQLRMQGKEDLRDGMGRCMIDFIPFFRLYTDYIVKRKQGNERLAHLQKSSKKFREFLQINEHCVKRKLKSLLDQPVSRLPQYLQGMADLYVAWESEGGKDSDAAKDLYKAIIDIKKMTDEIAAKCKDQRSRRLVGNLQKDVFNNKILLIAAHRLVVKHGQLKIVKKGSATPHVFILCNDILAIATLPTRWSAGQLVAVFPLIGLRVLRNPTVEPELANEARFRFAVIPQNKNFSPNESAALGSLVIITSNQDELEDWIDLIEDTVEEEEHNLRPCNPVDLEKRLRREKTSREGTEPTINITDPEKIRAIEEWRAARALMTKKPKRSRPPPSGSAPRAPGAPGPAPGAPTAPRKSMPPSSGGRAPPPPSGEHRKSLPPRKQPPPSGKAPPPAPKNAPKKSPPKRPNPRAALLAGISGFNASNLKKSEKREPSHSSAASLGSNTGGDVASLLQNTLANYRTYVQDDSDGEQSDEDDWN